jgi:methionine aminotransferase
LADYSALSHLDDQAFSTFLTQKIGVAAIPISVFYEQPPANKIVRFCFAKQDATIHEAATKLCRLELIDP